MISFGTGRFVRKADPRLITDWLTWVLDALLHSPEEQQTELVARHFPETTFYRLEPNLSADIEMDDISRIADLEKMGEQFASRIDWNSMLHGDDTPFSVALPRSLPRAA